MVGGSSPYPTASKIEEALVKEPAEKKSRPSQHAPTVPAARKSIPSVKGEFSTSEGGKVSAPLPKSPPLPPPKVEVQSKSPSSAVPPPAVKPIPAPSVPPKAAGQHKRDSNMVDGGGPTKKATPPKTPSPSKVGALIPPVAQHVKHEVPAKPVATPSRADSKVTKSDLGVSASQAPTVPGDVPAPETQLDSQQSSQGQQGDGGYDGSKVETNVPAETTHAAAATRAPPDNTATTPTAPKQVTPPHVTPTQATPPPPKVTATPPPPKVTATPPPPKVPATPPSVKKPAVPKISENATPKAAKAAATPSPPPRTPIAPSEFQFAPGTTPIAPASYNERQAHYATFKRQVAKQDQSIPAEFIQAWNDAVKSNSRTAKNALFSKFCEAGGNWGSIFGSIYSFIYIYV